MLRKNRYDDDDDQHKFGGFRQHYYGDIFKTMNTNILISFGKFIAEC